MTKVLVATEKPFAATAVNEISKIFEDAGFQCDFFEKYTSQDDLINKVSDYDAMIVRSDKVTPEVIAAAKNLKIVVRAGAGYDNVDLASATNNNIVVMNTPGQNSNAVAELALGMMVYQARNHFNGKAGSELCCKTLGIHAYGNVGKLVAKIAKGFGMEVIAFDPFVEKSVIEADGVKVVETVEELYSSSDYLSLHIPANDKTKGSINYALLTSMKDNAVVVNTARKEVIDEDGLVKAMEEKSGLQYVSDIAPNNAEMLLSKFEGRCFFTPKKMGAQTAEANINAGKAAASQIIKFLVDGDTTYKVN